MLPSSWGIGVFSEAFRGFGSRRLFEAICNPVANKTRPLGLDPNRLALCSIREHYDQSLRSSYEDRILGWDLQCLLALRSERWQ
jgi:hypothetical protein